MDKIYNSISLTHWAGTIAKCFDIEPPKEADTPIEWLVDALKADVGGKFDRVLIYNPDAQAQWLIQKYTEDYAPMLKYMKYTIPMQTVMPSFTPVCFGTMYTGVLPVVHGIQSYSKPIIKTDCLFDALLRQGKKTCLAAVEGCSMSKIFIDRPIDYCFRPYDGEVVDSAIELIKEDNHDFIAVYNQEFDDKMHAKGPEHPDSLQAFKNHVASFVRLAEAVKEHWKDHNTLIVWATDHGVHLANEGYGWHGTDIARDLNIFHFFGTIPASNK